MVTLSGWTVLCASEQNPRTSANRSKGQSRLFVTALGDTTILPLPANCTYNGSLPGRDNAQRDVGRVYNLQRRFGGIVYCFIPIFAVFEHRALGKSITKGAITECLVPQTSQYYLATCTRY